MKIIDLLNKIANNEKIPLKIKVKGYEYRQSNGQFWCDETEMYLIDNCTFICHLNDEIEIIEEDKKIEKLSYKYTNTYGNVSQHRKSEEPLIDKINELIDKVNSLEKRDN